MSPNKRTTRNLGVRPARVAQAVCGLILVTMLVMVGAAVQQRHSGPAPSVTNPVALAADTGMPGMHGTSSAASAVPGASATAPSPAQNVAADAAKAQAGSAASADTGARGDVNQDRLDDRAPAAAVFDGTYVVGKDVRPGSYRTTGPRAAEYPCTWALLGPGKPGQQPVLAGGTPSGTFVVTIPASAAAFRTSNCGLWQKA